MSQNGKGSKQRPRLISQKKWDKNWEITFRKDKCKMRDETYCETHQCGAYDDEQCGKLDCPHCTIKTERRKE